MSDDDRHLIFRGSHRLRENYEVQRRLDGQRLGCVNRRGRRWEARSDADGTWATGRTMREAALALWPPLLTQEWAMIDEVREAIYNPQTRTWVSGDVLAGPGPDDCRDVRCSRIGGRCVGLHCPRCGEPCGSQGHRCAEREADR